MEAKHGSAYWFNSFKNKRKTSMHTREDPDIPFARYDSALWDLSLKLELLVYVKKRPICQPLVSLFLMCSTCLEGPKST